MKVYSAADVARDLPYKPLIEALREGFRSEVTAPHRMVMETNSTTTLLIMPAWNTHHTGIKTVTVKSDNDARGVPAVQASYLLIDNATGSPVAIMDGTELTRRRTAAAGALAADCLARKDASTLLLVGAGSLATHFALAHAAVRPIKTVLVFNRTHEKAVRVARELHADGFATEAVTDLQAAMARADIISGITSATGPVIKGAWIKPGTHIDLAGAYKPTSRETDGAAVGMSRVFVDTRDGALAEAGDLLMAQSEGHFKWDQIQGDLFQLTRGTIAGRKSDTEVTLFKSCGSALEDLAAAVMLYLRR
jgi:ornithine cyclodeaminase/alanine dehydrogenase-like protein (mu-crystallin family)